MSDKTTAALAAEQADTEATTTQEAELLPAATLDELEQVDLGTVAEGERAPFRITDDRCADWAIRKIADERSEYDRLKALADEQIAAINEKVAAARKRMENGTSYLTSCLADFFATVPHKETKTTEKYRLLSGTLTFKKGTTKTKLDETKLVPWLTLHLPAFRAMAVCNQHLDHGPISIELDGSVILELADRLISDPGVHIEIGG